MAEKVEIRAGDKAYIRAAHSKPTEESVAERDELLIVMVHGFPGDKNVHGNLFLDLEFLLRDKGYHTLRFDFRGCGESDGREEDFTLSSAGEDFQNVLFWAKDQGYKRFVTIGEGLGAAFCLLNIDEQTACSILLWPYLDLPRIAKTLFRPEAIEEQWLKAGYILKDGKRIGINLIKEMQKHDIVFAMKEAKIPMLVMHGAEDKISPIEQLDLLRAHVGSKRVEITSFLDGEHGLSGLNHRKTMYYHVTQFIEKYA
jgi:pimeloyl-ACP methyl ester carboxylesterase